MGEEESSVEDCGRKIGGGRVGGKSGRKSGGGRVGGKMWRKRAQWKSVGGRVVEEEWQEEREEEWEEECGRKNGRKCC